MRTSGNDRRGTRRGTRRITGRITDDPTVLAALIALARLERDPSQLTLGLGDLADALVEIPRSIDIESQVDAASVIAELAGHPGWVIDRTAGTAQLAPDDRRRQLAGDRAARLDAAHELLTRCAAPQALARALGIARTYRLITISPDERAPCLAAGTWGGQDYMALRGWRGGDGLLFHVKQLGRLCALAVTTGDPTDATARSWQDTPRKAFPRRIGFRVLAQLDDGVDTRAALAPLRTREPASWFKGFVGTNHVLKPDDAAALLDAFEAALVASA